MRRPIASVAPKVRNSTAQGATLGFVVTRTIVALKGRHSADPHRAFANRMDLAGVTPRWG